MSTVRSFVLQSSHPVGCNIMACSFSRNVTNRQLRLSESVLTVLINALKLALVTNTSFVAEF